LLHDPGAWFVQLAVPPHAPHDTWAPSLFDHPVADLFGAQIWQPLLGLTVPLDWKLPLIQQPASQAPAEHTLPLPQLVPPADGVQVPVEQELH